MNDSASRAQAILLNAVALSYLALILRETMRSERKNTVKRSKVAVVVIILLQCVAEMCFPRFKVLARTVVQLLCSAMFLRNSVKPLMIVCAALCIIVSPLVLVYQALVAVNLLTTQNLSG